MLMFLFLCAILLTAFGVIGWLFYSVKKEELKAEMETAVPVVNVQEILAPKKEVPLINNVISEETDVAVPVLGEQSEGKGVVAEEDFVVADIEVKLEDAGAVSASDSDEIRQLKEEVKLIREKAVVQARNALEVINQLRGNLDRMSQENEQLKGDLSRPADDSEALSHLKAENGALKDELAQRGVERTKFLEEVEVFKTELLRKMQGAQDLITRLEAENSALKQLTQSVSTEKDGVVSHMREEYQRRIDELVREIELLKCMNTELRTSLSGASGWESERASMAKTTSEAQTALADILRESETWRSKIAMLETDNARLKEKNEFLQYELTKARAQAAGLERICENSRKRVEELSRQADIQERGVPVFEGPEKRADI